MFSWWFLLLAKAFYFCVLLVKLKIEIPYNLISPLLGIYMHTHTPTLKILMCKDIYIYLCLLHRCYYIQWPIYEGNPSAVNRWMDKHMIINIMDCWHLKFWWRQDAWVAQLIKCLILDLGSGQDLRFVRLGTTSGSALGMEPD